jgi:DNA-binding NtrC family response regulator
MYIDDEPRLCSAMKRVLELLGYRCTFYSDPRAALEAFRNNPDQFDATISDMTMPLLSGFDVAKQLQAIRPDIPIALTSGRCSNDTAMQASSLGLRSWLPKPATIDELNDVLGRLLPNAGQNPPLSGSGPTADQRQWS